MDARETDLCTTFDSTAEFDISFKKSPQDVLKNDTAKFDKLDDSISFQKNEVTNDLFSNTGNFENLSLDNGRFPSIVKVKEVKQEILEVNEAYSLWMTSQLMLDSCKMSEKHVRPELAARIREVTVASKLTNITQLKSRNGEVLNILGLDKRDIEAETGKSLSTQERNQLRNCAEALLKTKVDQLIAQRNKLKDMLGAQGHNVAACDSVMSEEQVMLANLHQQVKQQTERASQLLVDSNRTLHQLPQLVRRAIHDFNSTRYAALKDKARFLSITTSRCMHDMNQEVYKDQNYVKAINALGDSLKKSLDSKSEQLKSLEKSLKEYQRKEETSNTYKETVLEYAKTKRHLHHKYQTLSMLNEPDISFS